MSGMAKPSVPARYGTKATGSHLDFSFSRAERPRPLDPFVRRHEGFVLRPLPLPLDCGKRRQDWKGLRSSQMFDEPLCVLNETHPKRVPAWRFGLGPSPERRKSDGPFAAGRRFEGVLSKPKAATDDARRRPCARDQPTRVGPLALAVGLECGAACGNERRLCADAAPRKR